MSKFFSIFNSKTSFIFGVLLTLGGFQNFDLFAPGISVIVGTLAYVSAKKRKLGVTQSSKIKQILEIFCLLLIVFVVAWQNDLVRIIVNNPFPNIFIPAWIITAYLTVVFDNYFSFNGNRGKRIGAIIAAFIIVNIALFFALYSIPIKEYILNNEVHTKNTQTQPQKQLQEIKKPWQLSLYNENATLMRLDYDSKESCLLAGNFYYKDGFTQYKRFDCGYNCIGDKSDLSASQRCSTVCDNYGCK